MESKEGALHAFQNNGSEQLSQDGTFALTEISKTFASLLELSELLDAVMDEPVCVVEQAHIGATMLWDQTTRVFCPVAAFGNVFVQPDVKQL